MQRVFTSYYRFTQWLLAFVFVVILAGSVVRATQSGMGCPDWPTCFGNIIPPTQQEQVHFRPHHSYKKGQFIIQNDSLKYARHNFVSGSHYNANDWQQYEKHNYAHFNVYQTWIEYINRLCTGILGIMIVIHVVWSIRLFRKNDKTIIFFSVLLLMLTAFEAWMGKVVVDTNLSVVKITAHMLAALLIAADALFILERLKKPEKIVNRELKWMCTIALLATLLQVFLGTEVREQIDAITYLTRNTHRELWISYLDTFFKVHRTFAWLVALLCIYLYWSATSYSSLHKIAISLLIIIISTMLFGLIMMYAHIPVFAQPLHLLSASILVIVLLNLRLRFQ
jgi:cytochrome c oxidase assembly protein subunit 15